MSPGHNRDTIDGFGWFKKLIPIPLRAQISQSLLLMKSLVSSFAIALILTLPILTVAAPSNLTGNFQFSEEHYYKQFTNFQKEALVKSSQWKKISELANSPEAFQPGSHQEKQLNSCRSFLGPILNKQKIRIDYFASYSDGFRDTLHDPLEIRGLRATLLTPCSQHGNHKLCGFFPVNGNPFLLSRKIRHADGHEKTIEIQLVDSALTSSDQANKQNILEQNKKSEMVRQKFITALKSTDIMIYSGHSRFGGGPDFYPERFLANGADDVNYYLSHKRGVNDMLTGLSGRTDRPFMMFMGSCDSKKHFASALASSSQAPYFSFLTKKAVTENDVYKQFVHVMTLILNESCPVDFKNQFEDFEIIKN